MRYLFAIIITSFLIMSIVQADHKKFVLEFDEFLAREELLMLQMNLWELFTQLEYTHGEQRLVVKEEIENIQEQINSKINEIQNLDSKYHSD